MVDTVVIDLDESEKPEMKSPDRITIAKKPLKRKRASMTESLSSEQRLAQIEALRAELDSLFKYYREVLDEKVDLDLRNCNSNNSRIACLLEESSLSLSKLVERVFEGMKAEEDAENGGSVTLASVKSSVLLIGQRLLYGVPNVDADVLEDETEACLWCWETRDVKLMPKSVRGAIRIRRTCRKKIHERITAVSAMIKALQNSESQSNGHEQMKASERLCKVLGEADIRLSVESMVQKNGSDRAEKEAKKDEKLIIKQLERNKREAEKEKKRVELELQKEKRQSEKELKRLQEEAEKEERRRQKEEIEMKKQLKRQQEEAEKDQRRREKEEAELKKQLAFQKQASLMERFLKRSKNNSTCQTITKEMTSETSPNMSKAMPESITHLMDCALSLKDGITTEDMWKSHLISWCHLGHSIRSNGKQHWGMRQKPKTELVKEIKLTSRGLAHDDELSIEKLVDGWDEMDIDSGTNDRKEDSSLHNPPRRSRSKQLLQFDKSHRPAFYGIWSKKSQAVGPRHPFVKDPDLDYDVDSDEEWEEDEPGESLSDCDKDDEEANLDRLSKAEDEDESEDGFFVPDGYLSENEGVNDRMDSDHLGEEARNSPSCKPEMEGEFCLFIRQQKCLHNLTENALRKNQPLIISNLMLEKAPLFGTENVTGTQKLEQMCFQALRMRALPGFPLIEISIENTVREEGQEACPSHQKGSTTPVSTVTAILESELPQIVFVIQSCSHGINKLVEVLQQKFPTTPKSQLRSKVREISDFVDNRWQVKKNILDKLGLSISPVSEKGGRRTKSIASFFSKRCLPPTSKAFNPNETSPQLSHKPATTVQQQQYTQYHQ